jgi:hypothetical protein
MMQHISVLDIDKKIHRRTLGFLTSIAWFAPDKEKACASVWGGLEEGSDHSKLLDRFNKTRFKDACRLSKQSKLQMIPLPTPELLERFASVLSMGETRPRREILQQYISRMANSGQITTGGMNNLCQY